MLGQQIEQESFRIIRAEMGPHNFSKEELAVVVRVIHTTADFDFAQIIRFHPRALQAGIEALRRGSPIVTDVRMAAVGISAEALSRLGGRVICDIGQAEVAAQAAAEQQTRATLAIRRNKTSLDGGIAAVGNAPTALLEVLRLVREEGIRPALIIGVPVGFVSAVESKEELLGLDVPFITTVGRKGGSTVAAAVVNALLKLALKDRQPDGALNR